MDKEIIYYTDNRAIEEILAPVKKILTEIGKERNIPITSVALKPIDFGDKRIVLENRERSYPTMVTQIVMALEYSSAKYVFFCENDVLYHESHFDFIPPKNDVFFYNRSVWRWRLWDDVAITYDGMLPLSCLCVNREFALKHYRMRLEKIKEWKLDEIRSREPRWARRWGYEPGTKKRRRGGFTDDDYGIWHSEYPNIDIRHKRTFSRLKCTLDDFKNQPTGWKEISINEISGWNLHQIFKFNINK